MFFNEDGTMPEETTEVTETPATEEAAAEGTEETHTEGSTEPAM